MLSINLNKCFELTQRKTERPALTKQQDWEMLLIKKMSELLPKYTVKMLQSKLSQHLRDSTYSMKNHVEEGMQQIFSIFMDPSVSDDKKLNALLRLEDGWDGCYEGFHDRVNEILISFSTLDSLSQILEKMRFNLVDRIARKFGHEVHAYNRFFVVANTAGYGVCPIQAMDKYQGSIADDIIIRSLAEGFKVYTPWHIYQGVLAELEGVLRESYGYMGYKAVGYTIGEFDPILNFLAKILEQKVDYSIFITDDNDGIVDINWSFLATMLVDKLQKDSYFRQDSLAIPPEQLTETWILGGMSDKAFLEQIQSAEHDPTLIDLNLNYLPEHHKKVLSQLKAESDERVKTVLDPLFNYIDNNAENIDRSVVNNLINQCLNASVPLFREKDKLTALNSENMNLLMLAVMYAPESVSLALQKVENLARSKNMIFTQRGLSGCNALMQAIIVDEESTDRMFEVVSTLDIATQKAIFSAENQSGKNALLLAIEKEYPPDKVIKLLGRSEFNSKNILAVLSYVKGKKLVHADEMSLRSSLQHCLKDATRKEKLEILELYPSFLDDNFGLALFYRLYWNTNNEPNEIGILLEYAEHLMLKSATAPTSLKILMTKNANGATIFEYALFRRDDKKIKEWLPRLQAIANTIVCLRLIEDAYYSDDEDESGASYQHIRYLAKVFQTAASLFPKFLPDIFAIFQESCPQYLPELYQPLRNKKAKAYFRLKEAVWGLSKEVTSYCDDQKHRDLYEQANQLYESVKKHVEAFEASFNSKDEEQRLKELLDTVRQAYKNPIFKKEITLLEKVGKVIAALTVIGGLILIGKAIYNSKQNKNLFFASNMEKRLGKIENQAEKLKAMPPPKTRR